MLHCGTSCLVCLTSNLKCCSLSLFFLALAGVRRATMDYAVTSLYPRQMLSCRTQVRSLFLFFILQYWCIYLRHENKFITSACHMPRSESQQDKYKSHEISLTLTLAAQDCIVQQAQRLYKKLASGAPWGPRG